MSDSWLWHSPAALVLVSLAIFVVISSLAQATYSSAA